MNAKVTWQGKMAFEGIADRGYVLPLDADPEVGGESKGFSPFELLALGVAGCTAMDVISILQKKRQAITALEVKLHGDRANEHPKVFTHLSLEYVVTGHAVDPAAVERAVQLSDEKYCGAIAMLRKSASIDHTITILEAQPQ
ncbi:MAG TPA: OsmC family protein [Anaerolineaceae bacterium]|jgi:putative redox protein